MDNIEHNLITSAETTKSTAVSLEEVFDGVRARDEQLAEGIRELVSMLNSVHAGLLKAATRWHDVSD